jgi:NAD(P)-dependent dehydrogenase (short-subunit alcohol dehydrogenase family)
MPGNELGVALVTGANKGIGFEVARQLGQAGWLVLLGARNSQKGADAAQQLRGEGLDVRFLEIDVADAGSVSAAAHSIEADPGRLDILVNNAGVLFEGDFSRSAEPDDIVLPPPSTVDIEVVRRTFSVNTFGAIQVTNALLPILLRSSAPRIVNVSSKLASLSLADEALGRRGGERYLNLLAYNSSKAALNAATLQYAIELRDTAIKVNAVDPGHCATDINGNLGDRHPSEAARTIVRLATLSPDGPTGAFIEEAGRRAW